MALGTRHWRERAEHARTVAAWLKNSEAKRLLLEVAERYERIAKISERETLGGVEPPLATE